MKFFIHKVLPLIRQDNPDVQLKVTGKTGDVNLSELSLDEGITLTGYLKDVRQAVAASWVAVAPIVSGGGTRLKILEAMALGTPVVSTSKGAEGLEITHGQDILIADDPKSIAQATCGCF